VISSPALRSPLRALLGAILLAGASAPLGAQSLRGSDQSVDEMYSNARRRGLAFHRTPRDVRAAATKGTIVRLRGTRDVHVKGVSYPYVHPTTLAFVQRLARDYRAQCKEPLVVTSAVRPQTRQPANGSPKSVHPTGIAVDLRKPRKSACLRWLRTRLLTLEKAGTIEATEEHNPPHFHVAVYSSGAPRTRVASRQQ